jgi:5-methyltetrahydropteroyltriglutamate--homocysteine methyltransferase
MTATTISPDTTAPARRVVRPIPTTRLVKVELRKMFNTRSGFWMLVSIGVLSVIATGAVLIFAPDGEITYENFAAAIGFPMSVILPMIAILGVTSEWSQRSGLTTFTLVPSRGRVIGAKAIATFVVGVVSMAVAFAVGAVGNLLGSRTMGLDTVAEGIELETASPRRFGPPAHDQRGRHAITGELRAPRGLGVVDEFKRLQRLAPSGPTLKASVPGPYTLSGRLVPNAQYPDRWAITEALLPIVRRELEDLVTAGCREVSIDEPSMSCYAYKEDTRRFVEIFNRTVEPVVGKCRLSTHLCFGNYKARAVGLRRYAPMFPAFLDFTLDEIHVEMASREFAEVEVIKTIAERRDVAVGIVDVKSYYIETPADIAERIDLCLNHAPADRLAFAPDCGLSQTARWAAKQKLKNMVEGVEIVRKKRGGL